MVTPFFDHHGPISINRRTDARLRLRQLAQAAREVLPGDWLSAVGQRARNAAADAAEDEAAQAHNGLVAWTTRPSAAGDVMADMLERYAGARAADMSEGDIRERAVELARRAQALHFDCTGKGGEWHAWERLCAWVTGYGGVIRLTKTARTLKAWTLRACDPRWWRRQLRRYVAHLYEKGAYELGRIGAASNQWYCSDRAVKRRVQQVQQNMAMMAATAIENEAGQKMSLLDVASRSVSNKAIRRGELMTRIRGCEEYANTAGLCGVFTTNTCPSRFHSQIKGGGSNKKWDGSLPDSAQKWLCTQWARLRAKWAREDIKVMGFRVAEPHHDGCPHWHMLLWCESRHVERVRETMVAQWLKEDGDEPGAAEYRCKVIDMLPGMAAGYISKYIAKNIDDAHVEEGHIDDEAPSIELGADLLGDMEIKPSMRVEAWAATWRIRQFQAIGQPSVTVWRELRRVTLDQAAAGSDAMIHAWLAAHRERDRLASWQRYMRAQGGAMLARNDYRLCVHTIERERQGRYGAMRAAWACGVTDRARVGEQCVTPSQRREWGAVGFAARHAAPPWTRFNNCTRHNGAKVGSVVGALAKMREALGLGADFSEHGPP